MTLPWLILDMDEGVIRREPTRRAAVAWIIDHHGGKVLRRHLYGPGDCEYTIGDPADEESRVGYFVERLDVASLDGWDWSFAIPDLYPYPDEPHRRTEVDRDALIAQARRRASEAS